MRRRGIALLLALVLLGVSGCMRPWPGHGGGGGHGGGHDRPKPEHPIVFVHGFAGSGAQFESQALRLTSNGYPASWIDVHEYDSTFALAPMEDVWAGLDERITRLLDATDAEQVDLAGHSLGTTVLQGYLTSSPERAARVAHYVNIDGRSAAAPPGGVPTLAVWGMGDPSREIVGAENYRDPTQSHVEVATSAETFDVIHEFLTGRAPRTTDIVPEPPGRVEIAGRVLIFLSNEAPAGATLELWRVDRRTGHRVDDEPEATEVLGEDGSWGPFRVNGRHHYELALTRGGDTHHFYAAPFLRSSHLVRLLTSEPGTGIDVLRETSDRHTTLTVVRNKEIWGDQGRTGNDVLTVAGSNLALPAIAPQGKRVIGLFAFDRGVDGVTDLSQPIPTLFALPFLSGADLVLPSGPPPSPPEGSIRIEMVHRSGEGRPEVINVPNWPSSSHHVSVMLRDFSQRDDTFP